MADRGRFWRLAVPTDLALELDGADWALAGLEAGTVNIGTSEANARVTLEQCRENLVGRVVQGQMKVTHSVVPPALAL